MYLNNDLTNNKNKIKEDILLLDNQYFFELILKKTKTKELTIENIRFEMYNDKRIYIMIEN